MRYHLLWVRWFADERMPGRREADAIALCHPFRPPGMP
jgi:hypothetical protein